MRILKVTEERREGKVIVRTNLFFNAKSASSILRMLAVVTLAEKFGVEVGQTIGDEFENAGLIAYQFAVPTSLLTNYFAEQEAPEPDILGGEEIPEPLPKDAFIAEMETLYQSFYNQL